MVPKSEGKGNAHERESKFFHVLGFIWYWRSVHERWSTFLAQKTFPKFNFNCFFVNLRMPNDMTKAKKVSVEPFSMGNFKVIPSF